MSTSTQCLDCKHYTGIVTCDAFPDVIPQEIFDGRVIHDVPYEGDGGIMYDPIDIELSADQMRDVVKILDDKGLLKGEKGVKMEWRTVTRGGKTFKQRFRVGQKEPEKSQVADVPDELAGMTLEEFKKNPIEGFMYDPRLDYDEIVAERRHDKGKTYTALSTQFFKNKPGDKKRLLFHEMGHDLDDTKNFMDLFILRDSGKVDSRNVPDYKNWFGANWKPNEIIADAYAILRTEDWRDWVGSKKVEAGRFLFRTATVAKESGYPIPKDVHKELTEYFDGDIDIPRKEKVKVTKGTDPGKITHLPESIQNEIVTLHKFPYTPEQIVSNLETMIQLDCDDDTDLKDQLISKGVIKSVDGKISLDITLKEMGDWAQSVLDEEVKKFEIPDELLEAIDIDPKKMSPDQIKAMFAKLKDKGLLNDKPADKKSTGKESGTKEPDGAQGSGKPGLVKKKVTVHRGGKTFEQERWVKAGEDESTEKPKKGEDEPEGKPGEKPEPEKPKGPVILGTNKPEGEDGESEDVKGKEFMDWQPGDDYPEGIAVGAKVDVGKWGEHTITDITGGSIIGEDGKSYALTSIEGVVTPAKEDVKPESTPNKDVKKPEAKTEDEKSDKTPGDKVEKISMTKDNLKSMNGGEDIGLPASAHSGGINLCEFKSGEKSIYKVSGSINDIVGEIGFYSLSQSLGWDICPQTEATDLGKGDGTSQEFVNGKEPLYADVRESDDCIKVEEKHFNNLAEIFVMDVIVGNPDRHFQNVKINEDGKCWAIDNDMWAENTYMQNHPKRVRDVLENLQASAGGGQIHHYDAFTDWLNYSLDESGYKKFKEVVNEKMTEILKHKDELASHYVYKGEQYRMDIIDTYVEGAEKYLASEQKT